MPIDASEQKLVNKFCFIGILAYPMDIIGWRYGARRRTRTVTAVKPRDFKSLVSTNSTTRALDDDAESTSNSIIKKMEAEPGIEPRSTALQAAA